MLSIRDSVGEAYYGLPKEIEKEMYRLLSPELKNIVEEFIYYIFQCNEETQKKE